MPESLTVDDLALVTPLPAAPAASDARTYLADYGHSADALAAMPDADVVKLHGTVNAALDKHRPIQQPKDWKADIADEPLKKLAEPFKTPVDALKALAAKSAAPDWRAGITDDELKKVAERFASPVDALKAVADLRKRESNSIRIPAKDAKADSPEAVAFRKALGIPDEPKGYLEGLARPDFIAEDDWKSERVQGLLTGFAQRMHARGASKEAVQEAIKFELEAEAAIAKAQVEADKRYAAETEAALKTEWGADYDKNTELARRAAAKLFGEHADAASRLEDKQGRYVLDNPVFRKALARVGREMGEGTLGAVLSDAERASLDDQLRTVRKQIEEAQANRDSKRANELYQQELALAAKKSGTQPVVGAAGRAA